MSAQNSLPAEPQSAEKSNSTEKSNRADKSNRAEKSEKPETRAQRKIETILAAYPESRDFLLSSLHEIQRGGEGKSWISDEDARLIARHFHMPLAELDGVVSFYKMFSREKRGLHVIRLCDSLSCHVCSSLDLYRHLRQKLGISAGMTTKDGKFTLEIVNCLGACDRAPNMMIDDRLVSGLSFNEIDALLEKLKEAGR